MWEKGSGGGGGVGWDGVGRLLLILSHILNNWSVNNHDCVNESL